MHVWHRPGVVKPSASRKDNSATDKGEKEKDAAGSADSTPVSRKKSVGFATPVVNGVREVGL